MLYLRTYGYAYCTTQTNNLGYFTNYKSIRTTYMLMPSTLYLWNTNCHWYWNDHLFLATDLNNELIFGSSLHLCFRITYSRNAHKIYSIKKFPRSGSGVPSSKFIKVSATCHTVDNFVIVVHISTTRLYIRDRWLTSDWELNVKCKICQ